MFEIILGIIASILALAFLAVGVLALLGGAQQKKRCSASVSGTVSALHAQEQQKGRRHVTIYTPEFKFEAGGAVYTMKAHFGSMRREFKVGQSVTIRYDPADPKSAYVADDMNNSAQGGIMCVIFGLLLAVGAVALFT